MCIESGFIIAPRAHFTKPTQSYFSSFVKISLTKNPKKRPTAERMLYHPFVLAGDLTSRLSLELLNKVRNPSGALGQALGGVDPGASGLGLEPDEEGLVENVPKRISSRKNREEKKTQSELNMEALSFEVPLEAPPGKFNNGRLGQGFNDEHPEVRSSQLRYSGLRLIGPLPDRPF